MSYIDSNGVRRSNRFSTPDAPTVEPEPENQPNSASIPIPNPRQMIHTNANDNTSILSQISDADLSYHPCSSQSNDPPDNTVNPYSLTTDPTIVQLKQTLLSFNSRVDNIESATQDRFADIERQIELCRLETQQQIQLSQASLTAIFKQGFESLSQNVAEQLQLRNNQTPTTTTVPSPPESTHQIPQSTTPDQPNSQPNHRNVKSPDPPENTDESFPPPPTHIRNPYTTPNRSQPTIPNQLHINNTATHHTIPSAPDSNQPTQTIIVQPPVRDIRPLKIPNYTTKIGYSQFRTMSLLHISASTDYSTMVIINPDTNKPMLNPHMSDKQSRALYLATVNALGPHASEIVSRTLTTTPNGITLWKSLDAHFLRIHTSHVLKNELKREYDTLKKV
jgi:hypothetical protein